jgi:hypothetical protein
VRTAAILLIWPAWPPVTTHWSPAIGTSASSGLTCSPRLGLEERAGRGRVIRPPKCTSIAKGWALHPHAARLRDATIRAIAAAGPSTTRTTRSQISFRRRRGFAWIWAPQQYLGSRSAPVALALAFPRHVRSWRWKEVVEPRPGWFMHHLEVWRVSDVDQQVRRWISAAWEAAV